MTPQPRPDQSGWLDHAADLDTGWRPGLPEPEPTMCDFCSTAGDRASLTRFGCATFTRRMIMRRATGELLVETCHCHTPIATQPGDETVEQGCHGAWAACPDCAEAIVADDPARLATLAADRALRDDPSLADLPLPPMTMIDRDSGHARTIAAPNWAAFYALTHLGFFLHRTGDPA